LSIVTVLAHEIGHSVQFQLKDVTNDTPTIIAEQQADCYAGAFFRSVAEGQSARFQVSTGAGLNQVLQTLFFVRDKPGSAVENPNAHGTAFDRVTAFQEGFGDGAPRCRKIDQAEIDQRIVQQSETQAGAEDVNGSDLAFDNDALKDLESTLRAKFGKNVKAVFTVGAAGCPSVKATNLASYCPDTEAVLFDTNVVNAIGKPLDKGGFGDFAAFSELASRFTLSVQKAAGLKLTGEGAAQRTACLTGTWAASIKAGKQQALRLSPGDLDEAINEMLAPDGIIGADLDSRTVPSGFARVTAFRTGFIGCTTETCEKAYP
jgi:predicted metalloprotease